MASVASDRLAPIEAACIAGYLGDWRVGQNGPAALERGLRFAASRYAAFPDAACHHDRAAAHRVAVDQVLELAGFKGGDDAARRSAVVDAFNRVDDAVNLAAQLGGSARDRTGEAPSPNRTGYRVGTHGLPLTRPHGSHTSHHERRF